MAAELGGRPLLPPPPPLPWAPVLTRAQLRRGLSFYGSGERIERVAAKLMAGEPITIVTLGASVTRGQGASEEATAYPSLLFDFISHNFPHRDHVIVNRAIGATNSGLYATCFEQLVPPETDLAVVEFTFNEFPSAPYPDPTRRGFEQLLRKLLRLPSSPAVVVLHHFAWYYSYGDGVDAGLYYRPAEAQLGTMAQYYDIPSLSVRNAVYSRMQADAAPFKVSRIIQPGLTTKMNHSLLAAEAGSEADYYFRDLIHPADTGHRVMAELLAAVVQAAVQNLVADGHSSSSSSSSSEAFKGLQEEDTEQAQEEDGIEEAQQLHAALAVEEALPPPMIPNNVDHPTSVCAMQEDFKPVAVAMDGFNWTAERPKGFTFVDQKWGYRGLSMGSWVELEVSTLQEEKAEEGVLGTVAEEQKRSTPEGTSNATLHLGYLRSYERMGLAQATCTQGCSCEPSYIDGLWADRTSLTQMHSIKVSQHPTCRIRITIVARTADTPGGLNLHGAGRKFQISSVMVAHVPVTVSATNEQATELRHMMHK
ncbi:hypothetical protein D9Q98_006670 [Chlorella vulgaris]|uniref:SGNH hydrolase-type esterase domain-containing protein n=1 Tax=Chlorella vulgaris TaxID=3077 RepID=A0A9D4YVB1_CHLVU|nr:hypothetical protein D9Q98_006670 [Chlorella vulgaris]